MIGLILLSLSFLGDIDQMMDREGFVPCVLVRFEVVVILARCLGLGCVAAKGCHGRRKGAAMSIASLITVNSGAGDAAGCRDACYVDVFRRFVICRYRGLCSYVLLPERDMNDVSSEEGDASFCCCPLSRVRKLQENNKQTNRFDDDDQNFDQTHALPLPLITLIIKSRDQPRSPTA